MRTRVFAAAVALGWVATSAPAGATPIGGPYPCTNGTCQGSIYELTYSGSPISTTATTQTFEITLTIDASGYTGTGTRIDDVAPKVSDSVVSAALVSAPGVLGDWQVFLSGINAGGCSMAGSGFVCAGDLPPLTSAPTVPGGTYAWVFDLEVPTGTLLTALGAASIKVRYSDDLGNKVGALVSEPITLEVVPEPATALLFAAGLLGLAAVRGRRSGAR